MYLLLSSYVSTNLSCFLSSYLSTNPVPPNHLCFSLFRSLFFSFKMSVCEFVFGDVTTGSKSKNESTKHKFSKVSSLLNLLHKVTMGWLQLVGSLKLEVSFAEYSLFYRDLLQKAARYSMYYIK